MKCKCGADFQRTEQQAVDMIKARGLELPLSLVADLCDRCFGRIADMNDQAKKSGVVTMMFEAVHAKVEKCQDMDELKALADHFCVGFAKGITSAADKRLELRAVHLVLIGQVAVLSCFMDAIGSQTFYGARNAVIDALNRLGSKFEAAEKNDGKTAEG